MSFRYKQVIVMRRDLGMRPGKMAAQAAHAAVLGIERAIEEGRRDWLNGWRLDGMPKVVLQVSTQDDLEKVCAQATEAGLPVAVVADRGLTQVPAGTVTCAGIGPAPTDQIDRVTGHLKLY